MANYSELELYLQDEHFETIDDNITNQSHQSATKVNLSNIALHPRLNWIKCWI